MKFLQPIPQALSINDSPTFAGLTLSGNLTFSDTGEGVSFHGGGTLTGASGALTLTAAGPLLVGTSTTDNVDIFSNGSGNVRLRIPGSGASITTVGGVNFTSTGQIIGSVNSAASTPAGTYTGTWFTGGSATTTKPHFLIEPTGTTSTGWSTSGTGLGVNAASGFAGNLGDFQIAGTSKLAIAVFGTDAGPSGGGVTMNFGAGNSELRFTATNGFAFSSGAQAASDIWLRRSAASKLKMLGAGATVGGLLDLSVADTFKFRNIADSADAAITAGAGTFSGAVVAGAPGAAALILGGAEAAVTTATKLTKTVGSIGDAAATAVLTVTIPNAAHSASLKVRLAGSLGAGGAIGANEATGTVSYDFAIARTAGVNAVTTISSAYGSAMANVAGAATITVTAAASAISGAVGATNTFTVNVTITRGSGSSTNHTCMVLAEICNANATGITIA